MEKTLETLDKSLSILLEGATEKGGKLIDWLYEQAPETIEQLLFWKGTESFVYFIFGALLIALVPVLTIKGARKWCSFINGCDFSYKTDKQAATWIPIIVSTIIVTLASQINGWQMINLTWLKIYLAPKVFLLDYITNNI